MPPSDDEEDAATRAALQRFVQAGVDLTRPRVVEFFVAVPDEASGRVVEQRAARLGFETRLRHDTGQETWTCYCAKEIAPTYETVRAVEELLDELARDVGGYADGFETCVDPL